MTITRWRPPVLAAGACLALAVALPATSATAQPGAHPAARLAAPAYTQTNLVSDVAGWAQIQDKNLVNPWGVSFLPATTTGPASPLWVSDNGPGLSTLYAGGVHGGPQSIAPLVVTIPGGAPTGQASNPSSGFVVTAADTSSGPAKFLFVGETGHITGWNPTVGASAPGATSTQAQDAIVTPHAIYKGLAMGQTPKGPRLYAANFGSGQVEMYNSTWGRVHFPNAFVDRMLPKGFAPFNVMVSGDRVYVAYAKADGLDEVDGPGLGRVDIFTLSGQLVHRLAGSRWLDAPWGMAIAPAGFGAFSGDLIVGNFGNGRIHAFRPNTLSFVGTLRDGQDHPITIDGLWSLIVGSGTEGGTDELVFTAGPDDESHGLLGTLRAATP